MAQTSLPPELLDEITFHLQDEYSTLKMCSLTCRLWNHLARSYLYRKVVIRQNEELSSESNDLSILSFPLYNPMYTTHLTINSNRALDYKLAWKVLDQFTQVRTLTLSEIRLPSFAKIPPATNFTKRITSLRLDRISSTDFSAIPYLVLNFPSLRCLAVHPDGQIGATHRHLLPRRFGTDDDLPPLDCLHFYLDTSTHLRCTTTLMLLAIRRKPTRRLHIVTHFTENECTVLRPIFSRVVDTLETLTMGIKPIETTSLDTFHRPIPHFVQLHTINLTNLDFSVAHNVTVTYAFVCILFNDLLQSYDPPLQRITLSFSPRTTSQDDIVRALSSTNTRKEDLTSVISNESYLSELLASSHPSGSSQNPQTSTQLKNIWELIDNRLSDVVSFPRLQEVVLQIRGVERAVTRVASIDGDPDHEEMKPQDLQIFASRLLPLCEQGGLVKVEIGLEQLEGGMWEIHDFEE